MDTTSLVVAVLLVLATAAQIAQFVALVRLMNRDGTEPLSDAECPPAMVILCLRGGDEFLCRSLSALAAQDYPDYRVRIIVDSVHDEAHKYIHEVFGETLPPHVEVQILTNRLPTCTGRCSSTLQATSSIPAGVEIVAIMDGDVVPHSTWLRSLAAPIVRRNVDVSTGNRWYFPEHASMGSMCRFWWGAIVFPLMAFFKHPWGGTVAYKRAMFENPRFREWLSYSSCDDISTGQFLIDNGLRVHFEPSLTIVNREDTGLRGYYIFLVRQMMFVKLESRRYWKMVLAGSTAVAIPLYPALRLMGMPMSGWTDAVFGVFVAVYWICVFGVAITVRRTVKKRGELLPPWSLRRTMLSFGAIVLMAILHVVATVQSTFKRRFYWRGVWYRIAPPSRARVEVDEWAVARGESGVPAAPHKV